jgi:GGDEF domain-containing protein
VKILAEGDFRAAVRSEVRRCTRYSQWFAVVGVDLPTSGESEAFIRMAAEVVGSDVRETDVIGRLKGFRLGVILHHAEFGDAYLIAERIRERLASDPALPSRPSGFAADAFRTVVFPEMASTRTRCSATGHSEEEARTTMRARPAGARN